MELIRNLPIRLGNTGRTVSWGLFLCPFCFQIVERPLSQGNRYQSCGCVRYKLSSESLKGKKKSEKTKQLMREAKIGKYIGKNNPMYGIKMLGELAPNWQGGKSFEIYPPEFNKELKQFILERDNHICQCPNCEEKSTILHVHHIDYNKKNNNPENLIVLCMNCHLITNGKNNRDYYIEYYQTIMMGKIMECLL